MDYDYITNIESCHIDVPSLLYYSHIPAAAIALLLGIFILIKSKGNRLAAKIFFWVTVVFASWVLIEGAIWLLYNSVTMMFLWSFLGLLYAVLHILSVYFVYSFFDKRDVPFIKKIIFVLLLLPIVILTPTNYNITGFDIPNCQAIEGDYFIIYRYFVGIISILWIIGIIYSRYRKADQLSKKQILLVGSGVLFYLFLFSWSEIVGSLTENFDITQYGLFGMPVLLGLLSYTMVKFKAFSIKLIGAQGLIISLVVLIGSEFFFIHTDINRILTAITLVITGIIGINLIRSVKKEVAQREQIEKQEKELEKANERLKELDQLKSEFVSLATHQIRGPLTAMKGYASMMIEGDYGEVPQAMKEPVDTIFQSCQSLAVIVDDFLNVSRIEQGKMKYDFTDFDFCALVGEVVTEARPVLERRGLGVSVTTCPAPVTVHGDRGKLKQVVGNLLDNSMKYTPKGSITVTLSSDTAAKKVLFSIKDTGVGIGAQTIPHLFQKFSRAEDASKVNILGTGLGLYVAAQMIKAHGGRIWVESEGEGKGATFFVELKTV